MDTQRIICFLHLLAMPFVFIPAFACFVTPGFNLVPLIICTIITFLVYMNSLLKSFPREVNPKDFEIRVVK